MTWITITTNNTVEYVTINAFEYARIIYFMKETAHQKIGGSILSEKFYFFISTTKLSIRLEMCATKQEQQVHSADSLSH